MKEQDKGDLRKQLIGLGEMSSQKTYYPELQKRIEELEVAEAKYHSIFNNVSEGIFQTKLQGKIININPSIARILGYKDQQQFLLELDNIKSVYLDQNDRHKLINLLKEKENVEKYKVQLKKKNQEIIWVSLNAKLMKDKNGEISHIEGTITDITKGVKQNKQIIAAKEVAEKANKIKNQFLANISHEIRTPMNGIIGMLEILKFTKLNEAQNKYIENIEISSDNLLRIINDLLDISKIEAGKIELYEEEFSLEGLIEKATESFVAQAHKKDLDLIQFVEKDIPFAVIGDKNKINQVMLNLIGNAIKFTNKGEIFVGVKKIWEDSSKVKLQFFVKDTGVGISINNEINIFEFFEQGDSSYTKKYQGTGLGLSISKKLVEVMGGEISFFSVENKGTKFYFEMEMKKSNARVYEEKASDFKKTNLLLIDNNNISREITEKMLEGEVEEIQTVASVEEGIKLLKINKYDLLLLDVHMPEMDEFMVINQIKDVLDKSAMTTIIFISVDIEGDLKKLDEYGIKKYLVKPVKRKELINKIRDALKVKILNKEDKEIRIEKTILLAEDNEINAMTVTLFLERKGYKVIAAEDGLKAIEKLKKNHIDLILMDIQMPVMNGVEAVKEIRKEKRWKNLPIIAFTAYAMKEDRENFINYGMDDYVSKPVNPNLLYKKIEILLDKI